MIETTRTLMKIIIIIKLILNNQFIEKLKDQNFIGDQNLMVYQAHFLLIKKIKKHLILIQLINNPKIKQIIHSMLNIGHIMEFQLL